MSDHRDIPGFEALEELALDLIWSWNHGADEIWRKLDEDLFEITGSPWVVLQTVSRDKLKTFLEDKTIRAKIDSLLKTHVHTREKTWFTEKYGDKISCVAYFSMEFMLSEALPIYSGGLGNVAGDQLKAASDLGVPVIGIGLLYQQGYFRQIIDAEGRQQAAYPFNSPTQLPVQPLRKEDGEWLRIQIVLPGWSLWLRAWEVKIGRVKLYLLDSNDLANYPVYRGITSELYGGDLEMRLRQELVLGIGGVRLLEMLGIKPDVYHLNEGHAAFAILERIKNCMKEQNLSFEEALCLVRPSHLFTTHTAVSAGFDRFPMELVEKHLIYFAKNHLHVPLPKVLDLGREEGSSDWFNMAHFAIRGSGSINGVSRLHGCVSRELFSPLFPRFPVDEIPISYVTNGIHTPSWVSEPAELLWQKKFKISHTSTESEAFNSEASDEEIWQMRGAARLEMIKYARKNFSCILAARGMSTDLVEKAKTIFDPNILTLGFARRFATYKRPNMLLADPGRFIRILTDSQRPVQLLIAGKAHPADHPGQAMIQEWISFIRRAEVRCHVIFLTDYDMQIAEKLVQGVDVWINTPRRPWEACGTSGMKVLVNGGLNLSILDGWWAEAYDPKFGWSLGDGQEHGNDPAFDEKEALQLYDLLEREIIPQFYQRDEKNIPRAWVQRIRESMLQLTPKFSAHRAVREYTEEHYLPAALRYQKRLADGAKLAKKIAALQNLWKEKSSSITFQKLDIQLQDQNYHMKLSINLGPFDPNEILVQMYAAGSPPFCQPMRKISPSLYEIEVPANRAANDYCPRVMPQIADVNVRLELPYILWQR